MFICQVSGKQSQPGEKPFKLVTKTRQRTYTNKLKRGTKTFEKVSHGWEIVEEKVVCKEVYEKLSSSQNRSQNYYSQEKEQTFQKPLDDNKFRSFKKFDNSRRGRPEEKFKKNFRPKHGKFLQNNSKQQNPPKVNQQQKQFQQKTKKGFNTN